MSVPRFSIVIPAYNAETTLAETLDAVLTQGFQDWECVVVDDGSIDGTRTLAELYAERDPRIRVLTQQNRGTGGAYNSGVRTATGEWIVLCSADDLLLPDHLQTMDEYISMRGELDILTCNGYLLHSDGTRELRYADDRDRDEHPWSLEDLFIGCFFSVGACYRRNMFDAIGGYSEEIYGEDYDFWLRALGHSFTAVYIPRALAIHRFGGIQKSSAYERVLHSDIASISGAVAAGGLTPSQLAEAERAIRSRKLQLVRLALPTPIKALARRVRTAYGRLLTTRERDS